MRALLFIALSAVAVPACQHYDASGSGNENVQAALRLTVPSVTDRPPRVELKLDAYS